MFPARHSNVPVRKPENTKKWVMFGIRYSNVPVNKPENIDKIRNNDKNENNNNNTNGSYFSARHFNVQFGSMRKIVLSNVAVIRKKSCK